jgi:chemosensory pili system protein ChpA (sensor histidine kinase/response regulator)
MARDTEQEVKLYFLVEAQEYIDKLESGSIGLGTGKSDRQEIDALLRSAHSIKGGAAMMGFDTLSALAHQLEDFFKILKVGKNPEVVNEELEQLLLSAIDRLRQVVAFDRQGKTVDEAWLTANVNPIFDNLHQRLGDWEPADETVLLSAEAGEDMVVLLFETEVEGCLQRLESVLANPALPCLREEFEIAAQELGGLGEMLELTAFSSLCQSVIEQLETHLDREEEIARLALQEWRRSQAMVYIGQTAALPSQLHLGNPARSIPALKEDLPTPLESSEPASLDLDSFDVPLTSEEALPIPLDLDPESVEPQFIVEEALPIPLDSFETADFDLEALDPQLTTADFAREAEELFSSLEITVPNLSQKAAAPIVVSPLEITAASTPVPSEPVAPPPTKETAENTIRVPVRQLDRLNDLFGELTIERNGLDLYLKRLGNLMGLLTQRVQVLEKSNFHLRTAYDRVATGVATAPLVPQLAVVGSSLGDRQDFDVLEMDRYNDLHLVSQEIMDTVVQIQEVTTDLKLELEDTERFARDINRTSKLMQSSITQLQMRPVADLVGRFPVALREMELKYGKQVELKIRGGSTLIDRSILEALNEPLLHLFRNAFDHGIEDRATRQAAGKPAIGTIEISAAYRGNQTIIVIKDDGGGINLDKIRARALQMGLAEADLAAATKQDLLDLIFEPGFSTAERVTDLSGRGVGMDVVRTNLRQIRGDIRVDTQPGTGTTFTIAVPFTLSVVRVLLVESGGMMLAFPNSAVEEMLRLDPEMILSAAGKEVLNWEGFMIPLIRLHQWLEFNRFRPQVETETVPAIDEPTLLMVSQGDDLVGIQVDRYWGEQEVTIRQVEGNLAMPAGFSGCTILGDGRVVPLVDAIAFLEWIDRSQALSQSIRQKLDVYSAGQLPSVTVAPQHKNQILVVDDSINVRRFLALTLEKAGYQVEQARDGQEALEKLRSGLSPQAVISDIEMPRLDGYGFLAQVKSDPNCQRLPILMLTSRSSDKHRQLAMNLGASAYFSKPFKEQELLKTLQQLL